MANRLNPRRAHQRRRYQKTRKPVKPPTVAFKTLLAERVAARLKAKEDAKESEHFTRYRDAGQRGVTKPCWDCVQFGHLHCAPEEPLTIEELADYAIGLKPRPRRRRRLKRILRPGHFLQEGLVVSETLREFLALHEETLKLYLELNRIEWARFRSGLEPSSLVVEYMNIGGFALGRRDFRSLIALAERWAR